MYLNVLRIDMCIGRHVYRPSEQFKVFALYKCDGVQRVDLQIRI